MECEEEVCPDSTTEGVTEEADYRQYSHAPDPNTFQPHTVNLMAHKSHNVDGSDLPHSGSS